MDHRYKPKPNREAPLNDLRDLHAQSETIASREVDVEDDVVDVQRNVVELTWECWSQELHSIISLHRRP